MNGLEQIIIDKFKAQPALEAIPTELTPKLRKINNVKAILFDVYGTLFISGSGDVGTATATNRDEVMATLLTKFGVKESILGHNGAKLLKQKIIESHSGSRAAGIDYPEVEIRTIWGQIFTENHINLSEEQVEAFALAYEYEINPTVPMPRALEVLQHLSTRGFPLGIVSNAQFYTPYLFLAFFGKEVERCGFDPTLCAWSYCERCAKPSAQLFPKPLNVLKEKYGIQPKETLYVGNDMLNDVWTAQQAGCKTALFAGDKRSLRLRENDERCLAIEPDAVITSLAQLLEIIEC